MKRIIAMSLIAFGSLQMSGCSVMTAVATSNRMEQARTANIGKQLVPNDGGTYLISVARETSSYLGTGDTDFKINNTAFTQPKGTYSVIKVQPGTYTVYGNMRVVGGGEAKAAVTVNAGEAVCVTEFNPISAPARIEMGKGNACDPLLRSLTNKNIVTSVN